MFDNNSDYALNKKDKDSIVYKGCDGSEQRISREQFATEEVLIQSTRVVGSTETEDYPLDLLNSIKISSIKR